jgi:hypothetical protein
MHKIHVFCSIAKYLEENRISSNGSNNSMKSENGDNDIEQQEKYIQMQFAQQKQQLSQELLDKTKMPASYWSNTEKEVQVLQYVDNFNRQYKQLYPGRKELLLTPDNEFGIKVCVLGPLPLVVA